MRRIRNGLLIVAITILIPVFLSEVPSASAAMKYGAMVTITEKGQVLDSITYNGVTVDAVYTYESYPSNDPVYCCAAFVKKFYSKVYGISVYNLSSTKSTPLVYYSKGNFSVTTEPKVGDIIRDNKSTHWAIVKAVNGTTISVIQQSYKTGATAFINCTIDLSDTRYTYFTYSNRVENSTATESPALLQDAQGSAEIQNTASLAETTVAPANPDTVTQTTGSDSSGSNTTGVNAISPDVGAELQSLIPQVTVTKKTLYTGYKSYTLKFTGISDTAQLSFSTSNPKVAEVNSKGKITPVNEGIAFITVKISQGGDTYQYNVTINVKKPYLKLTNSSKKLSIGDIVSFSAKTYGLSGEIVWNTSNQKIASVDSKTGEVTGIKKGTVTITATCNGVSVKKKVSVE
jgi:hypothetical protein